MTEKSVELLEKILVEHPKWTPNQIREYTGYSNRHIRRKKQELRDRETWAEDVLGFEPEEKETDEINTEEHSKDFMLELSRLRQTNQALSDKLRILRKADRTTHRYMNASEEFAKELTVALDKRSLIIGQYTKEHEIVHGSCTGISHLSDLHLNELINILNNVYDFKEASRRLRKGIHKSIFIYKLYNVEEVIIAMTGDTINSDRRLDELLNMATNRARACMLATHLLSQVIMDLNQYFNVSVVSVSGNESRIQQHVAYSDILISDNYDSMIYELLRAEFKHSEGVKFIPTNNIEEVIHVQGHNILLLHGEQIAGDTERKIQQIIGKYDVPISFVLFGHLHSCRISDRYARSSSLCGSNAYSSYGLQLAGRASQNIHLVQKSGIDSMKIDLQNTVGWSGYDIEKELEYYNAKSADRVSFLKGKTI